MEFQEIYSRIRQLRMHSRRIVNGIYSGNYRSIFRGPGLEFDEVREYNLQDDSRFIDWNVSSRMANLYTKKFREERELILQIIADISPSMNTGCGALNKRDVLNILLAHLAFSAVLTQDKVGALFCSDRIESWGAPRKGKTYALSLVQDCLRLQARGRGSDLAMALRTVYKSLKRRSIVVLLSDFKTTGFWKELALVAKKHDLIAIRIYDTLDTEFPKTGLVELVDPETYQVVLGYGNSKNFCRKYHDFGTLQRLHWKRQCLRRGAHVLEVSTQDDLGARLLSFFNRRK